MYIIAGISFCFIFILKFFKFKEDITTLECLAGALFSCVISIALHYGATAFTINSLTSDFQNLHGKVIDKKRVQEDCPVGWTEYSSDFCTEYITRTVEYNCRIIEEDDGTTSEECDTKTEYYYDFDYEVKWFVYTSLDLYEIQRIDSQGVLKPERWEIVNINDPVTLKNQYTNWLLVPNNAFVYPQVIGYNVPNYPNVFDYYNVNLVLGDSTNLVPEWNDIIREFLKDNGYKKEVNVIAHITTEPMEYFYSVMATWNGGKQNDVNLFFGIENNEIKWFNSTSFAKGSGNILLHKQMHYDIINLKNKADFNGALNIALNNILLNYNRTNMKNFEHIKDSINISTKMSIFVLFLSILSGLFISYLLSNNSYRDSK